MSQRKIIAVLNQKGGVGKTTTAINLSASVAKLGLQVLLVDFDPQGNASSGLGIDKNKLKTTSYEVLANPSKLANALQQTTTPNLFVLPANTNLASAELELANLHKREFQLKEALSNVTHDVVFIDCPPALGLLTINALTAADYIIIPVQAEYYALEGLSQLLTVVQRIRESVNPNLELLGVLLTMYDKRTSLGEQVLAELKEHVGSKLFTTTIPRNVRLAEAPSFGKTIFEHDKWSKGARAYKQLTKEIVRQING